MRPILYLLLVGSIFISCKKAEAKKEPTSTIISSKYSCTTPEVTDELWYKSGKKAPLFS